MRYTGRHFRGQSIAQVQSDNHEAARGMLTATLIGALFWSLVCALGWALI